MPLLKGSDIRSYSYVHYTLSEIPSLTISTILVHVPQHHYDSVSLNTFKNLTIRQQSHKQNICDTQCLLIIFCKMDCRRQLDYLLWGPWCCPHKTCTYWYYSVLAIAIRLAYTLMLPRYNNHCTDLFNILYPPFNAVKRLFICNIIH